MYLYVLFGLLIAKAVEPYNLCDRNRQNAANNMFNSLSNDIIDLDKKVQDTCKHFTSFAAREVFKKSGYRLEVSLPEFVNAEFVVKIKHRVIYINGHYPRQGETCDLTYVDIKVLPEFVNPRSASWTYSNGQFMVGFNYMYRLTDHTSDCRNLYIDETIIEPRRGYPNEEIFM